MLTNEKLEEFKKWLIERTAEGPIVPQQESFVETILDALRGETPFLTYANHGKGITESLEDAVITFIKYQVKTFGRPKYSVEPMLQQNNYHESGTTAASKSDRVEAWIKSMISEGRAAPAQEPRLKAILNSLPEDHRLS